MGAWIGELGALIELKCPASAGRSQAPDYSIETTLGGVDKAQVGRNVARAWDLDVGPAYPEATTALTRFHYGMYGLGPWWFIDPWAAVSNVMTPADSMPGPTYGSWASSQHVPSGSWQVPGMGLVRHSMIMNSSLITFGRAPVVPGLPVTGGAYISGTAATVLYTQVLDAAGTIIATASSTIPAASIPRRFTTTVKNVPPGGVTARVQVANATQAGLVSLAWSADSPGWVPGQGTHRALVEAVDISPAIAVTGGLVLGTHRASIIEMRG